MELDASGLEVLSREECLALLRQAVVGRIVFTANALPAILPVNFTVDVDDSIVIKTGSQTRLATAGAGTVVAFEVDELDPVTLSGWSVVVTGLLKAVRDAIEVAHLDRLGLRSWVPAERDRYLRLPPELVTGRRVRRAPQPGVPAPDGLRSLHPHS